MNSPVPMTHSLINTGAGWTCINCKRAWDQGESPPEHCVSDDYPFNAEEVGVRAIFDGERVPPHFVNVSITGPLDDDPDCQIRFFPFEPAEMTNLRLPDTPEMRNYLDAIDRYRGTLPMPKTAQVGGRHYSDLAIQPTEFCMKNGLDFCIGSTLKYLTRWRAKNGVEDLRKARHFVEIRESHWQEIQPVGRIRITMLEYVTRNRIRPDDAEALYRLEAYYNAAASPGTAAHGVGPKRLIGEIDNLIARAA